MTRLGAVSAIVRKDLTEFVRDRLWMVLTPLALVLFAVVFWLLPAEEDATVVVGVTPGALATALDLAARAGGGDPQAEGLRLVPFESEAALIDAIDQRRRVETGDDGREQVVQVGLAFPSDFLGAVLLGRETTVRVYVDASVPPELRGAMAGAVREAAYAATGSPPPVTPPDADAAVLGVDRAAQPVPLRERMRPLLAFFVLLTESLALASLLASEVASKTLSAVLATPTRVSDVIAAKGFVGTTLAFGQAVVLLLVTQAFAFGANPLPLLAAVALGALLMAGVALLTGAAGGDFMTTLFLGVALMIPLTVPAFALLFPGSDSLWVRLLPSYGIVQAMVGAGTHGHGFGVLAGHLATGAAWAATVFAAGGFVLARKARTA